MYPNLSDSPIHFTRVSKPVLFDDIKSSVVHFINLKRVYTLKTYSIYEKDYAIKY